MALENILEKIGEDADIEAGSIINQAKKEAERIIALAGQEAVSMREEAARAGAEMAQREKEKLITMANLDGRKKVLAVKQKALDEIFENVKKRLDQLDEKEYAKLMKKLIMADAGQGKVTVVPGTDDRKVINKKLIDEINVELKGACKVELSEENTAIRRGFVLKSGKVEVDNSIDNIIKTARDRAQDEVAGMLFK